MPATLAELEVRVRALEDQAQRTERDTTDLVNTAVEIRGEVRWLRLAVQVLLDERGLTVPPAPTEGD